MPSLLSGAGTWVGATAEEYERCDKLQDMFWRVIMELPESYPRIALRAETRIITMKYRVWQQKLLLLRRIQRQSQETLSRQILEAQQANLSAEVKDICLELGIPYINENNMSERDIQKAVLEHHNRQLVLEVSKSKKIM